LIEPGTIIESDDYLQYEPEFTCHYKESNSQ